MLRTMSHEMIHMAKQMSPGYFERYSDFIFDNFLSENDVERIVVAAPIKIGEVDYYMGVMLQRDTQNQRLYLHNVVAVKAERQALLHKITVLRTGPVKMNLASSLQVYSKKP